MNEVAQICSDLIRFDTTNPGSGERPAAEYVAELLSETGIEPVVFESDRHRTNVVARIPGDSDEALLMHGHLDVVPAVAADWRIHPFSGEIKDGCVWGRGAVDMKGTLSMTLALVRDWARRGVRPKRDLVLAFLADEEATGEYGAKLAVQQHRELFDGCTEAISESGGYSVEATPDARIYPVSVGERGTAWMRLTAHGVAGHGSRPPADNAVAEICHALSRVASYRWPVRLTPGGGGPDHRPGGHPRREHRRRPPGEGGRTAGPDRQAVRGADPQLGESDDAGGRLQGQRGPRHGHGVRRRAVPARTTATSSWRRSTACSARRSPGSSSALGDAPSAPLDSPFFEQLCAALVAEDPAARPVPYVMSGGTDAKSFDTARHQGLRLRPADAQPGPRLLRHVPRRGRARPRRGPGVRRARPGPPDRHLLTPQPPSLPPPRLSSSRPIHSEL